MASRLGYALRIRVRTDQGVRFLTVGPLAGDRLPIDSELIHNYMKRALESFDRSFMTAGPQGPQVSVEYLETEFCASEIPETRRA